MPTYVYKCPNCELTFDCFHSMKDDPHILCEKCGTICNKQITGGNGIIFKGEGFYETDYKNK